MILPYNRLPYKWSLVYTFSLPAASTSTIDAATAPSPGRRRLSSSAETLVSPIWSSPPAFTYGRTSHPANPNAVRVIHSLSVSNGRDLCRRVGSSIKKERKKDWSSWKIVITVRLLSIWCCIYQTLKLCHTLIMIHKGWFSWLVESRKILRDKD